MKLKNKIVVITGGASGIGEAGATLFTQEGAIVNILDIDRNRGEQLEKEIKENGGDGCFYCTDMADLAEVKKTIKKITSTYNRIDVLWNHVGMSGPSGIDEVEESDFDLSITLNVKSGFFTTKYVLPYMKSSGGSIIFTSSIRGLVASPLSPVYSAGKGAVVNLVRSLAVRLGSDNIRVNSICPGLTETPMLKQFWSDKTGENFEKNKRHLIEDIPLGRLADPIDIAHAALFLASDDSQCITGVQLPVDGAYTAK